MFAADYNELPVFVKAWNIDWLKSKAYTVHVEAKIRESFIKAARLVLGEIGFGGIAVADDGYEPLAASGEMDMIAMIGLVGDLKGHLVLRFAAKEALAFVARLSGHLGMTGDDISDTRYRKSALGEIVNQIGGRAVEFLAEAQYDCMITPPTVISGSGLNAALPESEDRKTFTVRGDFGEFHCVIALKGSKTI